MQWKRKQSEGGTRAVRKEEGTQCNFIAGHKEDGREKNNLERERNVDAIFRRVRGVEINGPWEIEKEEDHVDCWPPK